MMDPEIWAAIDGFDKYQVSNYGRVRSKARGEWRLLVPNTARQYPSVNLYANGKMSATTIHKLVAAAFIGPRPTGTQICHNDGNRYNNDAANLRYDDPAANAYDTIKHKVHARTKNGRAKLCDKCVEAIKYLLSTGMGGSEIARAFNTSPTTISFIKLGKQWKD